MRGLAALFIAEGVLLMTITPNEINLILVGLGTFVTALGIAVPLIVTSLRGIRASVVQHAAETRAEIQAVRSETTEIKAHTEGQTGKIDKTLAQAEVIAHQVNSAATQAAAQLQAGHEREAALEKELALIRQFMAQQLQQSALHAQAGAIHQAQAAQIAPSTTPLIITEK